MAIPNLDAIDESNRSPRYSQNIPGSSPKDLYVSTVPIGNIYATWMPLAPPSYRKI